MKRPGPTTLGMIDTDYPDRPAHRGHTVEIQMWNDEHAMLVIHSDDRTNEAFINVKNAQEILRLTELNARTA